MARNDVLWKGLIEDLLPYFIPFFLPQHELLFDLSRQVAFLDKELQKLFPQAGKEQGTKFVDKLVKVNVYRFNTYKVLQQSEKQLGESNNPFAIAVLTVLLVLKKKKSVDENLFGLKLALVKQLFAKGFPKKTISGMLDFIKAYVNFAKPETEVKFDKKIDLITHNDQTMGIREQILDIAKKEGRKEGKLEGNRETLLERNTAFVESLLRSTDFTDGRIATLVEVPVKFVKEVRAKLGL